MIIKLTIMNPVSPSGMIDGGLSTTLPCGIAGGPPRPTGGPRYPPLPKFISFPFCSINFV